MRAGEDKPESTDSPTAAETSETRDNGSSVPHTPVPWYATDDGRIIDGDGMVIADECGIWEDADIGLIVQAVNAHDDLLAALQRYVDHFGDPLQCAREAIRKATGAQA
jgi:hypothetical protein